MAESSASPEPEGGPPPSGDPPAPTTGSTDSAAPPPAKGPKPRVRFELQTLLMVLGLYTAVIALTVEWPAIGGLLGFLCIPALVRSYRYSQRAESYGYRIGVGRKIRWFALALGISAVIFGCAAIAFLVTCIPLGAVGANAGLIGVLLAFGIGLYVALKTGKLVEEAFHDY